MKYGRPPITETRPEVAELVARLRKKDLSLADIATELARLGHVNSRGKQFSRSTLSNLLLRLKAAA